MNLENIKVYDNLVHSISDTYTSGKVKAFRYANSVLVETYWKIGQHIVEFEQGGNAKAEYGSHLLERLSKDLSLKFGKGFSLSNIQRFRQFFITFTIHAEVPHELQVSNNQLNIKRAELPHQLNWTHFVELMKIENPLERSFYEKQTIYENWSLKESKVANF